MKEHERPSRPVLFFTKESDYPYWGIGSSFFIASDQHVYWITARHVMEKQGALPHDLKITPGDDSAISVPFSELLQIEKGLDNEDFRDLYMLKVNMDEFWESTDSELYAWNISRDFYDCTKLSTGEELFLLGFPSESRFVDYDVKRIHFTQVVLRGIYLGQTSEEHCHELQLETSVTLEELDGLSGGVVFRYPRNPEEPSQMVGLLIRGTSKSGILRFIDCAVINEFVRLSEAV
ncbi:MAG: hypothetical protein OQL11_01775 [Gammaproteobacteria bacterium]|nr:hypothetical protein [Gammaproteobacteria bacterium]